MVVAPPSRALQVRLSMTHDDATRWDAVEEATELLLEGHHDPALAALKAVLDADPANSYAYHYVGVAMQQVGKKEAARDAYFAAVKLSPSYLAARLGLSHVLRELGYVDGAIVQAREAVARFGDDGDAHYALALGYIARGDKQPARIHLEKFLASKPEFEAQMEARGMLDALNKSDN